MNPKCERIVLQSEQAAWVHYGETAVAAGYPVKQSSYCLLIAHPSSLKLMQSAIL